MGTACLSDTVLDLNSPPPSSRTSSSSSSSSPPRSEISNIASATTSVASPATVATSTVKKQSSSGSTATVEADVKQQLAATTFIQADVLNFREVVQKHTGAAEDAQDKMPVTVPARQSGVKNQNSDSSQPPLRRHHMSRLHERKHNNLRNLDINRPGGGSPFKRTGCSPRSNSEISPKPHSALLPSPVTPLTSDASFEQQPLTPTESLRQSFASSLEIKSPVASPTPGTVLERFPFLHQQQYGFHQVTPVVHTHLQLANHAYVHQPNPHFVYEQHHVQREPELLDLFPVHSTTSLKDSQGR